MSRSIFNYRDITYDDLQNNFKIGELTDGDSFRESKTIPTYKEQKLRFQSPWLYCPFGWGQYNTLTLSSFSNRSFPLDNSSDKKDFREFLNNLSKKVQSYISDKINPDMLSTTVANPVEYKEQFGNFQYRFPIQKKYFNNNGEFEGKVFKSTDPDNLEYCPSSIKAIHGKSYASFVGYIGKITQSKNMIRYRIIIEQIHWFPLDGLITTEEEELSNDSNLFLNVPSLKKRNVTVTALPNVNTEYHEGLNDNIPQKKIKISH